MKCTTLHVCRLIFCHSLANYDEGITSIYQQQLCNLCSIVFFEIQISNQSAYYNTSLPNNHDNPSSSKLALTRWYV